MFEFILSRDKVYCWHFVTPSGLAMQAIIYSGDQLKILNQLKLPFIECYINVTNTSDGFDVIQKMQVKGAPAVHS